MVCCKKHLDPVKRISSQINKRLSVERRKASDELKILLLGASESGKSTIFKQLRLYYCKGFNEEEKKFFYHLIPENILQTIQTLIPVAAANSITLDFSLDASLYKNSPFSFSKPLGGSESSSEPEDHVPRCPPEQQEALFVMRNLVYTRAERDAIGKVVNAFLALNYDQLLAALKLATSNVLDSAEYWLRSAIRVFADAYDVPEADILRARCSTTGVEELPVSEHSDFGNIKFRILDVGGQRGERKKWMRLFDKNIHMLLYVASLAEYDQKDPEDESRWRLTESLLLFENLVNGPFRKLPVILFLNKKDIFEAKIAKKPLHEHFGEECARMKGVKHSMEFIRDLYLSRRKEDKCGAAYSYFLEATNKEMFGVVWKVAKNLLFEKNLGKSGLLYD